MAATPSNTESGASGVGGSHLHLAGTAGTMSRSAITDIDGRSSAHRPAHDAWVGRASSARMARIASAFVFACREPECSNPEAHVCSADRPYGGTGGLHRLSTRYRPLDGWVATD